MGRPSSLHSPYLQRRGASYYFRITIPPVLAPSAGRRVLKLSLRTAYLHTARIRAASVLAGLQAIMPAFAAPLHDGAPMENLRDKLESLLKEMNERWTRHHTGRTRPLEEDLLDNEVDTYSHVRGDCMEALQTGDVLRWKDSARRFIEEHHLPIEDGSSEFRELCYELGKLEARTLAFSLAALRGEEPPPATLPKATHEHSPAAPQQASLEGSLALSLSEVYERFCQYKTTQGAWKDPEESRSHDYDPIIPPFIAFVGDKQLGRLVLDDVERWATHIMAGEGRKLGTKKRDLDRVKALLNYARKRLGAPDLTGVLELEKGYSDIHDSYEPFAPEELVKLFNSDAYKANSFQKASQFWLPLIGLYTGARIDEPASLLLSDIVEHEGIPAFFMSGEGNAGGKNAYAPRWLPIHQKLIESGLLEYVELLRKEGHTRLFPDIGAAAREGYAKRATTDFTAYRRSVGVGTGEGSRSVKVFHSFRSTVSTQLTYAGVDGNTARKLVGHAAKDVHGRVYEKHLDARWLVPASVELAKLDYDLTHPKWADTEQYRKARKRKLNGPKGSGSDSHQGKE